ncbi:hypothetical protein GLW08_00865 [Pontibacillus yanchengensis]|uniref:Uncharacterized protein n=2 Tax=Pontibacillus yanchengensis TaxID=462910 RepID=A0ACC7VD55_9BACI|nr:hypothetical protein [Pontibacillus yanchengensis]MYL33285.1 hypothetical protein [Pontibacillus yanchengensis]MYL51879.1 hypothetical protein [Pontibacillus yanchengensis]
MIGTAVFQSDVNEFIMYEGMELETFSLLKHTGSWKCSFVTKRMEYMIPCYFVEREIDWDYGY